MRLRRSAVQGRPTRVVFLAKENRAVPGGRIRATARASSDKAGPGDGGGKGRRLSAAAGANVVEGLRDGCGARAAAAPKFAKLYAIGCLLCRAPYRQRVAEPARGLPVAGRWSSQLAS